MNQKLYQFIVVMLVIINSITLIAQVDYGNLSYSQSVKYFTYFFIFTLLY